MLNIPLLSHEAPYTFIALSFSLLFSLKPLKALRRSLINTSVFYAACLFGDLLAGLQRFAELEQSYHDARNEAPQHIPGSAAIGRKIREFFGLD